MSKKHFSVCFVPLATVLLLWSMDICSGLSWPSFYTPKCLSSRLAYFYINIRPWWFVCKLKPPPILACWEWVVSSALFELMASHLPLTPSGKGGTYTEFMGWINNLLKAQSKTKTGTIKTAILIAKVYRKRRCFAFHSKGVHHHEQNQMADESCRSVWLLRLLESSCYRIDCTWHKSGSFVLFWII